MLFDFFKFSRGISLEQNKEPALGRDIREFCNEVTKVTLIDTKNAPPVAPTSDDIIKYARLAGIVDETDGKKLASKLAAFKKNPPTAVVADAVDDEPYISSRLRPALEHSELMIKGLEFVMTAVGATQAHIAVCSDIFYEDTRVPKEILGYRTEKISDKYPTLDRTERKLAHKNDLLVGSCALIHLARALLENRMQTTCFVTVGGDCIASPANLEISLGKSVQSAIDFCGMSANPSRVVVGGSMTGYSVSNTSTAKITATTRAVLAFKDDFKELGYTCIGCGRCSKVCPEGLNPYYIYKFLTFKDKKFLDRFEPEFCTGCGTCSYVCPAKLDLSYKIQLAKHERQKAREEKKEWEVAAAMLAETRDEMSAKQVEEQETFAPAQDTPKEVKP